MLKNLCCIYMMMMMMWVMQRFYSCLWTRKNALYISVRVAYDTPYHGRRQIKFNAYTTQYMYLSSIVEEETPSPIRVLSISWSETLLAYQCSLLVPQTLARGRQVSWLVLFSGYRHLSWQSNVYVPISARWASGVPLVRNKDKSAICEIRTPQWMTNALCCYVCVLRNC